MASGLRQAISLSPGRSQQLQRCWLLDVTLHQVEQCVIQLADIGQRYSLIENQADAIQQLFFGVPGTGSLAFERQLLLLS